MTRRPLISVIHPTRRIEASEGFPQGWRSVYDAYRAACENPACVEYILVVHSSRWKQFWPSDFYNNADVRFWGRLRIVENTGRDCVVDQLNAGAKAATGVVLMGAMDDMYPPQDWDLKILEAMCGPRDSQGNFPGISALDRETILVCGTGAGVERDRELMIAGAVTKNRVDRIGYLLDPDFVTKTETRYLDVQTTWGQFYGSTTPLDRRASPNSTPVTVMLDLDFKRVFALYKDRLVRSE